MYEIVVHKEKNANYKIPIMCQLPAFSAYVLKLGSVVVETEKKPHTWKVYIRKYKPSTINHIKGVCI